MTGRGPWSWKHWALMLGTTALLFGLSLFVGRYHLSPGEVTNTFFSGLWGILTHGWAWACAWGADPAGAAVSIGPESAVPDLPHTVVFKIRLPRIIAALLVGGGLSLAGSSFQGLFKNPLVSPDVLGVASGAGFGAALGILTSGHPLVVQGSAFFFGLFAVTVAYGIGRMYGTGSILVLVLSGITISALFSALLSLVKYAADPYDTLPAIVFWLMGSLASVTGQDLMLVGPPIVAAGTVLFVIRWRINLLAMGEEEARALGLDTKKMTRIIVVCATIITASSVCISGIVGWVGLVVPHLGRLLVGPDFRKLIPVSTLVGASYLMMVDDISRTVFPTEVPLGILTAVIGAPVFAWLLTRRKVQWL